MQPENSRGERADQEVEELLPQLGRQLLDTSSANSVVRWKWSWLLSPSYSASIASHSARTGVHVDAVHGREVGGVEARAEQRFALGLALHVVAVSMACGGHGIAPCERGCSSGARRPRRWWGRRIRGRRARRWPGRCSVSRPSARPISSNGARRPGRALALARQRAQRAAQEPASPCTLSSSRRCRRRSRRRCRRAGLRSAAARAHRRGVGLARSRRPTGARAATPTRATSAAAPHGQQRGQRGMSSDGVAAALHGVVVSVTAPTGSGACRPSAGLRRELRGTAAAMRPAPVACAPGRGQQRAPPRAHPARSAASARAAPRATAGRAATGAARRCGPRRSVSGDVLALPSACAQPGGGDALERQVEGERQHDADAHHHAPVGDRVDRGARGQPGHQRQQRQAQRSKAPARSATRHAAPMPPCRTVLSSTPGQHQRRSRPPACARGRRGAPAPASPARPATAALAGRQRFGQAVLRPRTRVRRGGVSSAGSPCGSASSAAAQ